MESFPDKYHVLRPEFITKLKDFARFITHQETELCLTEHRGASKMLDDNLQPELPFDPHAVSEGWLAFDDPNRWTDMGEYLEREI
jgi:hypothetical protein